MHNSLHQLQQDFPYPNIKPNIQPLLDHGWMAQANKDLLKEYLNESTQVVIEIGSWLGMSLRHILEYAPNAIVIAIDTWKGSEEHFENPDLAILLPTLFETWTVNHWEYKDRIIPMRGDSFMMLNKLLEYDIVPDAIYIDGAHDYESVKKDVGLCMDNWSNKTVIIGDDWNWGHHEVNKAVEEIFEIKNLEFKTKDNCWYFKPFF